MATPCNPSYNRTAALVLGILQVVIGVVNIIVQIVMYAEDLYLIGPASVGVWTGIFFLITGILAIISHKSNTNCMIISVMVMCLISALAAGTGIFLAPFLWMLSTLTGNTYRGVTQYKYKIAEDVTITHGVLCFIYFICAIVLSAFCCQAVCCGARQDIQVCYVVTTTPGGGQQQAAYVYAAPGAQYPIVQTANPTVQVAYPPAQATYPPAQPSYPPAQATYPPPQAPYPQIQDYKPDGGEPTAPPEAPPEYTEKGQAY